jgi:hypothetical protein
MLIVVFVHTVLYGFWKIGKKYGGRGSGRGQLCIDV